MDTLSVPEGGKKTIYAYLSVFGAVTVLMMLLGLLMRIAQSGAMTIGPDIFYQVMTAHGVGMVGIVALGSAAIMWYFLRQYVELYTGILAANLIFFLAGVLCILGAIFIGGFAAGWTFLFPLPGQSAGVWSPYAAVLFLTGLLLVGVGFLLFYLDTGRALLAQYGNLGNALGWPQLFGKDTTAAPPPTVVASTMVTLINILALIVGAAILSMMIINILFPSFQLDALLAKNLIFFFGHTFINATIYMGVIAVYEILPRYAGRPWRSTKVFLAAWTASTVMVLIVYPHHLLMDFVMPTWMLIMGQIISYASGLPVLLVTTIGTLAIVYRSNIRWDLASSLLFLSVFGWAGGVVPAVIDGTIAVNQIMHNTQWVPGHFHFYLLLGVVAMIFGFMYYQIKQARKGEDSFVDRGALWLYTIAGTVFVFMFLFSGKEGVARRFAIHFPEWQVYAGIASIFASLVVLGAAIFALRFILRLGAKPA